MSRLGFLVAGALALPVTASQAAAASIPASEAFRLPSAKRCVHNGALTLRVRELDRGQWTRMTVKVDGEQVKRVTRPRPERPIRVRELPPVAFSMTIDARAEGGRTATVTRRYHPCAPGGKPTVTVPPGVPPARLGVRDLVTGTGARARKDDTVTVRYVLVTWSDRREVDVTWHPFTFTLDSGMVIEGFDRGITGMRVGGRREVIVPPALGYGAPGAPPAIGRNETLVFVIDLISLDSSRRSGRPA